MMKMSWKHRKATKKIIITLVIDEADFFIARLRLKKSHTVAEKLGILVDMAQVIELMREVDDLDAIMVTGKIHKTVNNI